MGILTIFKGRFRRIRGSRTRLQPVASAKSAEYLPYFRNVPSHPSYDPQHDEVLTLPDSSTYTFAMLGPTLYPWDDVTGCNLSARVGRMLQTCYMLATFAVVLQFFILYRLWDKAYESMSADYIPGCALTDDTLKFACNCIFTVATLSDLHETWLMIDWLRNCPTVAKRCELTVTRYGELHPAWGLTRRHKLAAFLCLLVPKIIIAVVLWLEGVAFNSLSESSDKVIVNMLALSFVTDLDEIIFASVATRTEQDTLAALPPIHRRVASSGSKRGMSVQDKMVHELSEATASVTQSVKTLATQASAGFEAGIESAQRVEEKSWLLAYQLDKVLMVTLVFVLAKISDMYICDDPFF